MYVLALLSASSYILCVGEEAGKKRTNELFGDSCAIRKEKTSRNNNMFSLCAKLFGEFPIVIYFFLLAFQKLFLATGNPVIIRGRRGWKDRLLLFSHIMCYRKEPVVSSERLMDSACCSWIFLNIVYSP